VTEHPPIDSLARFAQGLLPPREMATVAIHVARCETCRTAATRPSIDPGGHPATYGEAIRRVTRRASHRAAQHERETRRAPGALDQILALPAEEWNRAIRSSPKYHSYAFAQYALKTCKATWSDDPHRSERLAELALEVANRLPNKEHGRRNLNDLRSKAWGYIANCRRIQTNLAGIPDALQAATENLFLGTANEQSRAMLLGFTTSYLISSGRSEAALSVCAEMTDIATNKKNRHLKGRTLIFLSNLYDMEQHTDMSLDNAHKAAELFKGVNRSRLATIARHNLAAFQAVADDPQSALATLATIGPDERHTLPKLDCVRFRWTEGLIHQKLGNLEIAVPLLADSRKAFQQARTPCNVAFVNLDLARAWLDLGRFERSLALSAEALFTFALRSTERATLVALDLFRQSGGLA